MDFWLYWLGLGILLLIIEMFIMSFDFLSLGIAAFITAIFAYILNIDMANWHQSGIIFLIASVVAIMITRLIVAPRMSGEEGNSPMSGDTIIGKEFEVKKINGRLVIKYEGIYWNIKNKNHKAGEKVTVVDFDDNLVVVS